MADASALLIDPKLYRIARSPALESATPNAIIQYEVIGPRTLMASENYWGPAESVRWYIYRDRTTDNPRDYKRVADLGFGWTKAYQWTVAPGRYLVVCEIRTRLNPGSDARALLTLQQNVLTQEEIDSELAVMVGRAARRGLAEPDRADEMISLHMRNLDAIARNGPRPLTADEQKRHKEALERWETYRQKSADRLLSTEGRRRVPIAAVHVDTVTSERRQLNFFLARMGESEGRVCWKLVDWTKPGNRAEESESDGWGATDREAIEDAFSVWDWWRGRYPPGWIQFGIPHEVCGERFLLRFETDGATTWDTLIGGLQTVGTLAGLIAIGVATLGAAVPFEAAGSVAIYATAVSTVTGTGAEIIAIGQRRAEGIHDHRADMVSALSIISNIFAVKAQWLPRATVILGADRAVRAGRYVLIGATALETSTNVFQGILLAEDKFKKYQEILDDPSLLPEERANRLQEFFRSAALEGFLSYVNIRSNAKELRSLAGARGVGGQLQTRHDLEQLNDRAAVIDTTETPGTTGKDGQKTTKTVANTQEPRLQPATTNAEFPAPLPLAERGMSPKEEGGFTALSRRRIYLVRDCNPARLKVLEDPQFAGKVLAKPEKVKSKSIKRPESRYYGVVAAGPDDEVVQKFIQEHNAEHPEQPWEFHRDFEAVRAGFFEKKKLRIGDAAEEFIVRDADGNIFVSDIDMHGVFERSGTRVDSNDKAVQQEVNTVLGKEVVLHGGHDDWKLRLDKEVAGVNYGPQPPVTAYVDGQAVQLKTWEDIKRFSKKYNLGLEATYAGLDYDYWLTLVPGRAEAERAAVAAAAGSGGAQ